MQTSLVPGPLFKQTGLNRCSTPVGNRATSREIRDKFKRSDFHEDIEWPPDSPSAKVYDVSNSSAKLVILNNDKKKMRLRGYDNHPRPQSGNPDRHMAPNFPVANQDRHHTCADNTTPVYKPSTNLRDRWENTHARPAVDKTDRRRHASCQVTSDPSAYSLERSRPQKPAGVQHVMRKAPLTVQDNPNLIHPGMSESNKRCMYFIAQAYDLSNMKKLKQLAYRDLLMRQQYLGFHKESQYVKYMKYLEGPRKKQFGDKQSLFKSGQRHEDYRKRPESAPVGYTRTDTSASEQSSSVDSTPRTSRLYPLDRRQRPKSSKPASSSARERRRKPLLQEITEDDAYKSPLPVRKNAFEDEPVKAEDEKPVAKEEEDGEKLGRAPSEISLSSRSSRSSVSSKSSKSSISSKSTSSKTNYTSTKGNTTDGKSESGKKNDEAPEAQKRKSNEEKQDQEVVSNSEQDGNELVAGQSPRQPVLFDVEAERGDATVRTITTTKSSTSDLTITATEDPNADARSETKKKKVPTATLR